MANGDSDSELDPREGGLNGGIDGGIQNLQEERQREQLQREAAQQAGEDISPGDIAVSRTEEGIFQADLTEDALAREREQQRQQLREEAIAEIEGLSDPSLINIVEDGDQFRAELSEEGRAQLEQQQREQLREDALEEVEGVADPSAIEIVEDGDTLEAQLTESAQIDAAIAERDTIVQAEETPAVDDVERLSIDEAEELMDGYPVPPQREIVTSLRDVNLSELPESTVEDIVSALASGQNADIGLSPTGRTVDREGGPLSAEEQSQRVIVRPDENPLVTASEEEALIASEFGADSVQIAEGLGTSDRNVLDDFRSDTSPGTLDPSGGSGSGPIESRETMAGIPDGRDPENLQRAGRVEGGLEGLRFDSEGRSIIEGTPEEQGIESRYDDRGKDATQLENEFTERTGLDEDEVRVVQNYEGQLVAAPTEAFEETAEQQAAGLSDALEADDVEATVGADFETAFEADTADAREEIAAETPGLDPGQVDVGFSRSEDGDLQFERGVTDEGRRDIVAARAERQLEGRFDEDFGQEDIMVTESDGEFSARLSGREAVEQANESLIEQNRGATTDTSMEEVAAQLDQQVAGDVTAEDVTFRRTSEDGIVYGLTGEFRREQARQQVAQQIQEENPDADSIVARRAFGGLQAGEHYEVSFDGENVSAELTPEGREVVMRTLARTENPEADSQLVREGFDGELQFDDEGNITGTNRLEQDSLSDLVSGFEDATGVDLPGDGELVSTRTTEEQFGDIDWSFGLGGEGDEVEAALDDVSSFIAEGSRDFGEELFSEEVSGESLGEAVLDFAGQEQLGDQYDQALRNLGAGTVSGAGQLGALPPQLVTEAPEFVGYAATNPGETAQQLPGAVAERAVMTGEAAAENPARFTGTLIGSTALSGGLFKATQGTRAGTVARYSLQPGEELVKAGVRRGVLGDRAIAATPGVREGQIRSTDADGDAGGTGVLKDVAPDIRSRTPDVSVDADPNAGFLEIDPEVRQSIRETASDGATNVAERARQFPGGVRDAAGNIPDAVIGRTARDTRAGETDVQTQRAAMGRASSSDGGVADSLRQFRAGVRDRRETVGELVMGGMQGAAARTPTRSGEIAEQQAFLRGSSRPSFDAPSTDDVLGAARVAAEQGAQRMGRAGERAASATPDVSGDVGLQQAFTRGSAIPGPSADDVVGASRPLSKRALAADGRLVSEVRKQRPTYQAMLRCSRRSPAGVISRRPIGRILTGRRSAGSLNADARKRLRSGLQLPKPRPISAAASVTSGI